MGLPAPYRTDEQRGITLHVADAFALLESLEDASVSLIVTDPPYFRVKDIDWDRQWKTEADFLAWIGRLCDEFRRVLKPNGSLYLFASPQMAWGVEGEVRKRFNVLTNIRWQKPPFATKAEMFVKEDLREPFPASETIIFAEQYGSDKPYGDALIDGNQTYWSACESTKRGIFGDYLRADFERAGVTQRQIAALFPSASGGLTGCVSNWLLGYNCPTPEQYQEMREFLNNQGGEADYLRREYEDLRREYEDLRRPFFASADRPYTDVWTFPTVGNYPGKHLCEKPLAMLEHIVQTSSRPGDLVLDTFLGSGSCAHACQNLGRRFIGGDADSHWVAQTSRRLDGMRPMPVKRPRKSEVLPLFDNLDEVPA